MRIVSDNKAIQKELESLSKCMLDNGAWVDPDVLVVYRKETGLSIRMERMIDPRDFIIKIPDQQLVPYQSMHMALKGDEFVIDPDEETMSPNQIELAKRMVEIFNLTDKVNFHKRENVWIRYREAPELLDLLLAARSRNQDIEKKTDFLYDREGAASMEEFIVDSFSFSRFLTWEKKGSNSALHVVMPMIDYMNHDYRGSGLIGPANMDEEQGIRVVCSRPFISQNECYVSYGIYDGLNTFLNYGFVDTEVPFVRSIPMEIPVGDIGKIVVKSTYAKANKTSLPEPLQDLYPFMPVVEKNRDGELVLSHLLITMVPFPHALRRILRVVMRTIAGEAASEDFVLEQAQAAERMVLDENIAFYRKLVQEIGEFEASPSLVDQARQVATMQLNKLYKYFYDDKYFQAAAQGFRA